MAVVALVVHGERLQAMELARTASRWLVDHGHEVRLPEHDAEATGLASFGVAEDELAKGLDLAVSLGGDGTMLRTVDLVAAAGAAVIGVNCGQLGYLAAVEPSDMETAFERFLTGDYDIEERMLLDVLVEATGARALALNEAVLEKTPMGHTVRLHVAIDGTFWTTYAADGLIVATPTGSTAYSLSARGPIVAPDLHALVLTPVSPHQLFDRAMVFSERTRIRLEVCGARTATLSVDGRNLGELQEGDAVVCTGAEQTARLVTFGKRDFHRTLKSKFRLNDR
ncbi:MAG TPA: NAD(+)/NADH kinase [Acidimicrobiales bacterium]|jgi:NAD+ kinase|nr:NAD(+)/NADH kinase [Acidimicrobiales bacterium]